MWSRCRMGPRQLCVAGSLCISQLFIREWDLKFCATAREPHCSGWHSTIGAAAEAVASRGRT
jgi:hypothetical protein